ncbi:MAG TPA: Re/Si-specific NAD(P)(+) transhydrogenase subunit alpha [Thermoanaerobaculia bacterium]|nr:Re/Si-specific NAD(P)(+) transhydrogenase subunit alpha [Thermoanaerobaculia bacterium]
MKIAVPKETFPGESRVALLPQNVTALAKIGHQVAIESGAGTRAGVLDDDYRAAGASVATSRSELIGGVDVVLQVRGLGANPEAGRADLELLRRGQIVIAQQDPLWLPDLVREQAGRGLTVLALETIPRISRAQSMDVLSSMATIAGYKAVLLAAMKLPKMFPMLMTAAGTVAASRVLVLGAGVAGLQAIATARKLGAIVDGYDIRPAAAEQIKSLGAKVVELPLETADAEGAGGYAKEQGEDFQRRQRELLTEVVKERDVVITTAAIPGAKSPLLITRAMVEGMRPGSVIVDLAAERGGNCEVTEADREVVVGGVLVLGPTDLPSSVPRHASQMFANNLTTLLKHLTKEGAVALDFADEITRDTTVAHGGEVLHPRVRQKLGLPEKEAAAATPSSESGG